MSQGNAVSFPVWAWLLFAGLVLGLLFLDLFVLHRRAREVPLPEALALSAFWIAISLAFGGFVWAVGGAGAGGEYVTAYLVEKSLSLDNVFVFSVIFTAFAVPREYRYHLLFYGVLGAIVFRLAFVILGAAALSAFSWAVYVFGAFLIFTGARLARGGLAPQNPKDNRVLRVLQRRLPITEEFEGDNFFVRHGARRCATPLLAVLVVIESSDVLFAIDSVPAVLSVTRSTFVAYSSIVFAVLGLRALYFALEGLVDRFVYLHYGLAAILVLLGVEFVLEGFEIHVPIPVTLAAISTVITVAIAASLITTRGGETARREASARSA